MRRTIVLFALFFVALGVNRWQHRSSYTYGHTGGGLLMYSLTTCGNCTLKRRELAARGIPFTEYFIDVDGARNNEMWDKLSRAGYSSHGIGTPTFDVAGTMLPNNPALEEITIALKKARPRPVSPPPPG
jgi:hypothetical protein